MTSTTTTRVTTKHLAVGDTLNVQPSYKDFKLPRTIARIERSHGMVDIFFADHTHMRMGSATKVERLETSNQDTQNHDGASNPKEATMATKTKARKGNTKAKASTQLTNSNARKDAARKAGKCQLCGAKTKGHSVTVDYEAETVSKSPAGKAKQGHAFYCTDCADKKVKRYEWKLARRSGAAKPKRSRKAKATKANAKPRKVKGAAKVKAAAKPRKATTKAKASRKASKAQSSAEPF